MNTVRALLAQEPSRLFLSFVEVSERPRRQPSASSRRSHTPSALTASVPALRLVLRAVTPAVSLPAIRFRSVAPASFGRRFRNLASVRHTPPAPALWGGLPRLCNLFHRRYPHMSEYEKREASPPPFGGIKFTQSIRLPPCRECWKPTLSPLL